MTLEQAKQVMASRGCDYFDHFDETLEGWQEYLKASTVNSYKFLSDDIAINELPNGTAVKHYTNHNVNSWFVTA